MRRASNIFSSEILSHKYAYWSPCNGMACFFNWYNVRVYYKPRMSPTEFIVPFHKYMESIKRFSWTVVGYEDVDPTRWPGSKWRCLQVRWDEVSSFHLLNMVSLLKIEPILPSAVNVLPNCWLKRSHANIASSPADTLILTREENGLPKTLQGQESLNQGGTIAENKYPSRGQNQAEIGFGKPRLVPEKRISQVIRGEKNMSPAPVFWDPSKFNEFGQPLLSITLPTLIKWRRIFLTKDTHESGCSVFVYYKKKDRKERESLDVKAQQPYLSSSSSSFVGFFRTWFSLLAIWGKLACPSPSPFEHVHVSCVFFTILHFVCFIHTVYVVLLLVLFMLLCCLCLCCYYDSITFIIIMIVFTYVIIM